MDYIGQEQQKAVSGEASTEYIYAVTVEHRLVTTKQKTRVVACTDSFRGACFGKEFG